MATTKEYKEFAVEQLQVVGDIICRAMMGEYLLYYNGQLFGGIYDNRVLVKPTKKAREILKQAREEIPYEGAKPMLLIEELENQELLKEIIIETCKELKNK